MKMRDLSNPLAASEFDVDEPKIKRRSKVKTPDQGKVKVVKRKDGSVKKTVRVTPEGYKEKVKTSKSGKVREKIKDIDGKKWKTTWSKEGDLIKEKHKSKLSSGKGYKKKATNTEKGVKTKFRIGDTKRTSKSWKHGV